MSFILDALRKSEHERQQAAVPRISDVPAVVPRQRVPGWMLGIVAALAACVVVLGWAWLNGVGAPVGAPAAGVAPEPLPLDAGQTTAAPPADPGEVRSLAREARPPAAAAVPPAPSSAALSAVDGPLPSAAELRLSGADLPELNLELHVFSAAPAERFVFINASKYVEGERLPEGPSVVEITADGVVMNHLDQSFLLPRD